MTQHVDAGKDIPVVPVHYELLVVGLELTCLDSHLLQELGLQIDLFDLEFRLWLEVIQEYRFNC